MSETTRVAEKTLARMLDIVADNHLIRTSEVAKRIGDELAKRDTG